MLSVHLNAQILQHNDLEISFFLFFFFFFFFFFGIQALSVKGTSGWLPLLDKLIFFSLLFISTVQCLKRVQEAGNCVYQQC